MTEQPKPPTIPTPLPRSDEARWRAVLDRDTACDGAFVYAVRSTGVFCRPSCPSRRPKRANVAFFDLPEGAAASGFRPCRRCRKLDQVSAWKNAPSMTVSRQSSEPKSP